MHFDFMTPDVWNGILLGVIIIGLALAVLRLYSDYSRAALRRKEPPQENRRPPTRPRTK